MAIFMQGQLNTTALTTPDFYLQIVQPTAIIINGVPTNDLGIVGTATWGPTNTPVNLGTLGSYVQVFGPVMNRTFDMGTEVAIAAQQGAANFTCVRVTDGTDTKAAVILGATGVTLTSLYSGTAGNGISITLAAGNIPSTYTATVTMPNQQPEIYPNIAGTGNAFWLALAAAINNGIAAVNRGPSRIVSAVAGAGTTAPVAGTTPLVGGTDGAVTVTTATLIGADVIPRKGMYCLRKQGCSVLNLAQGTDSTQWSTVLAFAQSEALYPVMAFAAAAGDPAAGIAANTTSLNTAGLANPWIKVMLGDWCYWYDQTNSVTRLVSPASFVAGLLANLSPEQSTLNKQLFGIIGTQKSGLPGTGQAGTYAGADLQAIFGAGMDVITNPIPAGNQWGVRGGFNTSPVVGLSDDSYTRLTNYLAVTLNAAMGIYVGKPINQALLNAIGATLLGFLNTLLAQGLLGTVAGAGGQPVPPFTVVCNASNNPQARTAAGYVQADVQVQYMGINKNFICNLQAGSTVQISTQN